MFEQDSANVIFSLSEGNRSSAEYILVDSKKYTVKIHDNCKYDFTMSQSFFKIIHGDHVTMLPCHTIDITSYIRCKLLCDHVQYFSGRLDGQPHSFQCSVTESSVTEYNDLDEEIPARVFSFDARSLYVDVVITVYKFSFLIVGLDLFLPSRALLRESINQELSILNGAFYFKWSFSKTKMRAEGDRVQVVHERYADFVVFNSLNNLNIIVAEIKTTLVIGVLLNIMYRCLGCGRKIKLLCLEFKV